MRSAIRLASVSRKRATAAPTLPQPSRPTRIVGRPGSARVPPTSPALSLMTGEGYLAPGGLATREAGSRAVPGLSAASMPLFTGMRAKVAPEAARPPKLGTAPPLQAGPGTTFRRARSGCGRACYSSRASRSS